MSDAALTSVPAPVTESPQVRASRRIFKTLQVLRSGARDPAEAEVYLKEEQKWAAKVEKLEDAA